MTQDLFARANRSGWLVINLQWEMKSGAEGQN